MASIKRGAVIACMLMLIALTVSACKTPYSTPPVSTPTTGSLFETPINQTPGITMSDVANFGTSTALAQTGTPQAIATQTISVSTQDPNITQDPNASITPTALASANPSLAATSTLAAVGTPATAAPAGPRPSEWTLRSGEFPYCIARRFDVDPSALLSLNGLTNGNIFYAGRTLKIPQSGTFPGTRALRNHPATYTAAGNDTVYSIACLYGDVRPEDIVRANSLSSADVDLTSGQQLSIP
jgi:LysM repeat protein